MQRLTILKLKTLLSLETFYVESTVDIKQEKQNTKEKEGKTKKLESNRED